MDLCFWNSIKKSIIHRDDSNGIATIWDSNIRTNYVQKFKKKIKKKFSNSGGQLKPDPDNVITQLPTHEPEECFYIWMATFRPCQK